MRFAAMTTAYVSAETCKYVGHNPRSDFPVLVETVDQEVTPDDAVVVVTFEDILRAERGKRDMLPMALHLPDARKLCRDLLTQLARHGTAADRFMGQELLKALDKGKEQGLF